jgi:hypothetical protein
MQNKLSITQQKWNYFYEKLHDAIWYPHGFDWDNGDLMIEMFKMRDYLGNKQAPVNTPEFKSQFENGIYWKTIAERCAKSFKEA